MGIHANIGIDKFPKQGAYLGKSVKVCFNYDLSKEIEGIIIRDDLEDPGLTIIALQDNRIVMSTECQYSLTK